MIQLVKGFKGGESSLSHYSEWLIHRGSMIHSDMWYKALKDAKNTVAPDIKAHKTTHPNGSTSRTCVFFFCSNSTLRVHISGGNNVGWLKQILGFGLGYEIVR